MIILFFILFASRLFAVEQATVALYAVDTETGQLLIDTNSDLSVVPASCLKLFTTAAAIHILGPESRFETHLEYDGTIQDKTLHGNLYIKGGGDPCLGSSRFGGYQKQLDIWVDAIRKLGIEKIDGKVVPDATAWEKALAPPSWEFEDLANYYGAGASALSFNENSYTLYFQPGNATGDEAHIIRTDPPFIGATLHNEVKTGSLGSGDQAFIFGCEYCPIQFARGTIPLGAREFSIKGALADPAEVTSYLLCKALQGITVGTEALPQTKRTCFHTTYSPTVKEIVHLTNQKSVNLYAEHLLKQMGNGKTTRGLEKVKEFLLSLGIELSGFNMMDGSGHSRRNLVTAKQLVQLLLKMRHSQHYQIFYDSLPTQQDAVKAKSGSMAFIKSYAGYYDKVAFAFIINNCHDAAERQAKLLQILLMKEEPPELVE